MTLPSDPFSTQPATGTSSESKNLGSKSEALRQRLAQARANLPIEASRADCSSVIHPQPKGTQPQLSFTQERIWFLEQLEPGTAVYHRALYLRLFGPLDAPALERALRALIERHAPLRTVVVPQADGPQPRLLSPANFHLARTDLSEKKPEERAQACAAWARQEFECSFNLLQDFMLRAALLRLEECEHLLLLTAHHIAMDGLSDPVLLRDLSRLYEANLTGQPPVLPELSICYGDYATWQHRQIDDPRMKSHRDYWRNQLTGLSPLELPADLPRPASTNNLGGQESLVLPPDLVEGLRRLSAQTDTTLFMTLLAVFKLLLMRLSGQAVVTVGAPTSNRSRREIENLVGVFINHLVLRTDLSGDPDFGELLQRVRQTALQAYTRQELPFEQVLEAVQPGRQLNRTPLFGVYFNMLSEGDLPALGPLRLERFPFDKERSIFDLTLYIRERAGRFHLSLVYRTDLYRPERMAEMLRQYVFLLEQASSRPEWRLSQFSLRTESSRPLLPDPRQPLPDDWRGSIQSRLAFWAQTTPDQIVLVASRDGPTWTYAELEARSNQLAHLVVERGIQPGEIVAIYARRCPQLVQAVLGVFKAGAVVLILDPAYPPNRLQEYLEIARPAGVVLLPQIGPLPAQVQQKIDQVGPRACLTLDDDLLQAGSNHALSDRTQPEQPAWLSFTSGSTGKPKAVLGRHGSLTHFLPFQAEEFQLQPSDRFSLLSGLAHDPLQRDIFTALWVGASIHIPNPENIFQPGELANWMAAQGITYAHLTPPMCRMLVDTAAPGLVLPELRLAFFVGDRLLHDDVERLTRLAPNVTCINSYGSTETQRAVGFSRVVQPLDPLPVLSVGRGMPGAQLLVLNGGGGLAGVGELGEIFVRSPHLALGYLNDAELTSRRFLTNPFTGEAADRLYRTGDLGRYRPDGSLDYAGRADRQVKIRGYRVEPAEIEAALRSHALVQDACVIPREGENGSYLAAYVALRPELESTSGNQQSDLQRFLSACLPDYMVPATFVFLPKLPLTPNGKLNHAALPDPALVQAAIIKETRRTQTGLEKIIAGAWSDILGIVSPGMEDNFFFSGGHSLLGMRLFTRLQARLGLNLPIALLFQAPTIASLAQAIQPLLDGLPAAESGAPGELIPIQPQGTRPPLICVHTLGGSVLGYADFAAALGLDQPVYGLQDRGWSLSADETIESLAARHVKTLLKFQPTGPYFLTGYCFGGVVAYEMARQLTAQGARVAFLAILEGSAPRAWHRRTPFFSRRRWSAIRKSLPAWVGDYGQMGLGRVIRRAKAILTRPLANFQRRLGVDTAYYVGDFLPGGMADIPDELQSLLQTHLSALLNYLPGPYEGKVYLFRARYQGFNKTVFGPFDPAAGWAKNARGGIEAYEVEGFHRNIHLQPYVSSLAARFNDCLKLAQGRE